MNPTGVRPIPDRGGPAAARVPEEIGEIGAKLDAESQFVLPDIEITDQYSLVVCSVPDELEAVHMQ